MCKKISRSIGIMVLVLVLWYYVRPFLPLNVLKNVYYSLVYSHIVYAIEVWGSVLKTEMDKILILQKKAMRLMPFMDSYPTIPGPLKPSGPIFSQLKILKVMDILYHLQVAIFVFKSVNLITPSNFHDWFKLNHELHAHKTRAKSVLLIILLQNIYSYLWLKQQTMG